jgi:hypothetical protein
MAWTSFAELSARLDPSYQMKMGALREKVQAQYEIERFRANQNMEIARYQAYEAERRDESRAAETRDAERIRGENRIKEMELDLDHRIRLISADSFALTTQKTIDEGTATRAHLMRQIEARSQIRGDVFKMLAGAVIQEKIAQKQHARDMEKMKFEADTRRANTYLDSLSDYLRKLIESGEGKRAEAEIDHLTREWATEEKLSSDIEAFKKENRR